jgi:hypothetical protein
MTRTSANKANRNGKDIRSDTGSVGRCRCPGRRGRIPFAGIGGQERLRLLRRPLVRSLRRLPHDTATARQFFDPGLQAAWSSLKDESYDFLVQSPTWKLGAIAISILRRQFDKTYVAVAFDNHGRAVTLNFIVVNGPDGWVIADVESPHDSLRMFLAQYRN